MKKIKIRRFIIKLLDSLLYGFNIHKKTKKWAREIEKIPVLELNHAYKKIIHKLSIYHPFSISAANRVHIRKHKYIKKIKQNKPLNKKV